jgi:hypothetical protein
MPQVRTAAASLLALVALGLGGTACGGGTKAPSEAEQKAEAQWRTGFSRWGNDMIAALNGISILFSSPGTVDQLQRREARTIARLAAFERRLATCGARVRGLGAAPENLVGVREEALRACVNLERGSRQVRRGVTDWQNGRGIDGIDVATNTLGAGQDGILRARAELRAPRDE